MADLCSASGCGRDRGSGQARGGNRRAALQEGDLSVQATMDIHHLGKRAEIGLDVLGASGFLDEDLGDSRGSGLEADLGQLGGVVAAKMIDQLILVQPVLEHEIMFEAPLEMAASGQLEMLRSVTVKPSSSRRDDVLVRDAVAEHAVDHVALDFGETSDAASTACLLAMDGGWERFGVDDRCG